MTSAVEIRDLFRVHTSDEGSGVALAGLSLSLAEGGTLVVFGPSGAGKTTLLRTVAGFERPSAGAVRVFGVDVTTLSGAALARYRRAMLGYVDQHYSRALAPELTARELVALPLRLLGVSRRGRLSRADELLARVGLEGKRGARPAEMSGGEQQRVAVCAALSTRPRLLLADEPTGELDAASARLVYDAIRELVAEARCSALIASHDPAATTVADRVVRMRDGRVASEAADGQDLVVVGRGGWLRLPEELLAGAGITSLAHATGERGQIVLSPPSSPAASAPPSVDGRAPTPSLRPRSVADVRLAGVGKTYGRGAARTSPLVDLTASFEPGRFHVVTGPSGSGKTTLLQLVAGLELPTAGDVFVGGERISALDRSTRAAVRAHAIGVVGQHGGLTPFLTARETVELGLLIRGRRGRDATVAASLAAVDLAERADQRVATLSAGERARLAIARTVAAAPAVLLVDEPTARLDQANAVAVAALFRRLAWELSMTVICATHDPLVVEQADDELALGEREGVA